MERRQVILRWIIDSHLHRKKVKWLSITEGIKGIWINFDQKNVWIEYSNKSEKVILNERQYQLIAEFVKFL